MTKEHPVIPPYALLQEWIRRYNNKSTGIRNLLIEAAQWGADTELEECCKQFESNSVCGTKFQRNSSVRDLRNKRRPQPKEVTMKVSFTGTEEALQKLICKLQHAEEISIEL